LPFLFSSVVCVPSGNDFFNRRPNSPPLQFLPKRSKFSSRNVWGFAVVAKAFNFQTVVQPPRYRWF
jgi:hypothetical protein